MEIEDRQFSVPNLTLISYCRHGMSLSEMARKLDISQSGLTRAKGRFADELEKKKNLVEKIKLFERKLKSIAGV